MLKEARGQQYPTVPWQVQGQNSPQNRPRCHSQTAQILQAL